MMVKKWIIISFQDRAIFVLDFISFLTPLLLQGPVFAKDSLAFKLVSGAVLSRVVGLDKAPSERQGINAIK